MPFLWPVMAIIILNVFYFFPQFEGKVVRQVDTIQYLNMSKEAADYKKNKGQEILWTNAMFGGMPTFQISATNPSNLLKYVRSAAMVFLERPAGMFIFGMLGFYILLIVMGVNPWLSFLGSVLFGLSTNNFVLFEAGHNTKVAAIMSSPYVLAGLLLIFDEKYLLGSALFGSSLGINLMNNHPQMTYYLGICLFFVFSFKMAKVISSKNMSGLLKSLLFLLTMSVLALGSSASKLWTTYEYSKDTMRGDPILKSDNKTPQSSSETKGLEWSYAMQWSNGTGDLLASFIPKAVGGSSQEWVDGKESALGKVIGQRNEFQAPTYWGSLPFTSGPAYFGIVAMFLFVLGLFIVKNHHKWWLLAVFVLTMLMSMGKHFEFFNRFLFDYLPLYNKFRAPSSILSITAVFVPILSVLAVSEIFKSEDKSKFIKPILYSSGILGSLSLILWWFGGSFFDFTGTSDGQLAQVLNEVIQDRKDMLSNSARRSFIFVVLTAGSIWAYSTGKLNKNILTGILIFLGLADMVPIAKDYLDKRDFVSKSVYNQNFQPRAVDTKILQDNDPHFRVYDATINTFNSASSSYFHKTIGGYHAAKLQRFQDVIDRHISQNNESVLNMLNTKYYILPAENGEPTAQLNPAALGNAWYVNDIRMVANANEEIDALANFDPAGTAVVHEEFKAYIGGLSPEKNGQISLKSYNPDRMEYSSETSGEQLAVFSEVWYGPDKGWNAYIDGEHVDHIRVNYLLRGLKVPSGKHDIVFEFKPQSYYTGEKISLICSLLLVGLLGLSLVKEIKNNVL